MAFSKTTSHDFMHFNHGSVVTHEVMKYEALRLETFSNYPSKGLANPAALSKAGFYYYDQGDEVACYSCSIKIKDWGFSDEPLAVHKQYSAQCRFLSHNDENIALASSSRLSAGSLLPVNTSRINDTQLHQQPPIREYSRNLLLPNSYGNSAIFNTSTSTEEVQSQTFNPRYNINQSGDYYLESNRLASFRSFPSNAGISPSDLANTGFYYLGTDDKVQCFSCNGILRNWEPHDTPESEHRRHFPQCPFLNNTECPRNIPIETTGMLGNGVGNTKPENVESARPTQQVPEYIYGTIRGKPAHQNYTLLDQRLATFKGAVFSTTLSQKPKEFVDAGFFYTGIGDRMTCFFCDGSLDNWKSDENPWVEHAHWFPRCQYLSLCKGEEFITQVQQRYAVEALELRQEHRPPKQQNNAREICKADPTVVEHYLSGDIAKSVIDMGYNRSSVSQVITDRIKQFGDDYFPNVESLLDAVDEYEKDTENRKPKQQQCRTKQGNDIETDSEQLQNSRINSREENITEDSKDGLLLQENSNNVDVARISEEIERMRLERTCKVCMDNEVDIVFLKCGHLVCCSVCAPAMRLCPICRQQIHGTIRVCTS